jgi:hypothetical protein
VGSFDLTLADQSASSAAANRFAIGGNVAVPAGQSVALLYDATASRWRPLTFVGLGPDGSASRPAYSFASDPDTGVYRIGANNIGVACNGAKVLDIGTSGVGVVGALDLTGGTSGQVVFPATQNASAGANTLDDYEEGTWTPILNFSGGTTGITYSTQAGVYVKIGQLVAVQCNMILSNKGSSVGFANIAGLPFTCGSVYSVLCPYISTVNTTAPYFIGINASAASCFVQFLSGGAIINADNTTFNNTTTLFGAGSYRTTA